MPVELGTPSSTDGAAVHALIAACPPLDTNSMYCNLLQCSHFADTSAIARDAEGVLGFVSGYRPPAQPDVLFIWQVAVAARGRGQRLAGRLIDDILRRPQRPAVRFIETTITADNEASWALFRSIARHRDAELRHAPHFERDEHFQGSHATEHLVRIGPFPTESGDSNA